MARRLENPESVVRSVRKPLHATALLVLCVLTIDVRSQGAFSSDWRIEERIDRPEFAAPVAPGRVLPKLELPRETSTESAAAGDRTATRLLLGGLTESVEGFSALPSVADELARIQRRHGGRVLLDRDFTLEPLARALVETQPGIVHLATHARFGESAESSFILAYDGRLELTRLDALIGAGRFRRAPLELLVLSACETAIGDERAALGLAGIAVRAGARSALGSLWPVVDAATAELIGRFYDHLGAQGIGKAQALRRAQLALLGDPRYRHPAFWSPFLVINNWL